MTISKIQTNIDNTRSQHPASKQKKVVSSYLNATGAIPTVNNVKPLPPKGHLIKDNLFTSTKYFFKDIGYDMKAMKDGFQGKANDHQSGRLNDVGLKVGGLGIATYLASRTSNPKLRIMEFVGLGTFLTSMSLYPKIAINAPAKLLHGYDIDKEYIDDQGRKKSVQQDSNYVPYDMYQGYYPDEDIALIGDKMGIPRDIKNRNDVIKEQMRKIATQNNTLWMLTAGATPLMTALGCYAIENYIVDPLLLSHRNSKANKEIKRFLDITKNMDLNVSNIKENSLSRNVESLLNTYKNKELPFDELDRIVEMFTETLDSKTSQALEFDINRLVEKSGLAGKKYIYMDEESIAELISEAKKKTTREELVLTEEEFLNVLKKYAKESNNEKSVRVDFEKFNEIKKSIKNIISQKINNAPEEEKAFLKTEAKKIRTFIDSSIKTRDSYYVSENLIKDIMNFAKVIGDFKINRIMLDSCKNFKIEEAPNTVIASSYNKFERTFLDVLGISFKDLKRMRESTSFTEELLQSKINELCADDAKYSKAINKLGKILSEMEVNLHGSDEVKSNLLDLIHGIEYNYNNTAKRLKNLDSSFFKETIKALIAEEADTTVQKIHARDEVFDFLDGLIKNHYKDLDLRNFYNSDHFNSLSAPEKAEYIKANLRGLGSSKNSEIIRMFNRYQGAVNSLYRVLHLLELNKRFTNIADGSEQLAGLRRSSTEIEQIKEHAKKIVLTGNSTKFTLKNGLLNPQLYRDVFNIGWETIGGEHGFKTKGVITSLFKDALEDFNPVSKGQILERYQYYIGKFKDIIANCAIDFTKPHLHVHDRVALEYDQQVRTRLSMFNLVGQSPVEMAKGAAGRRYGTQKWVRIVSTATGSVFGIAILAQLCFGKLRNPQNIQKKQVNNDTSN